MVPLGPPGVRKAAEKKGKSQRGPGGWLELFVDMTDRNMSAKEVHCGSHTHTYTVSYFHVAQICELPYNMTLSCSYTWPDIQTQTPSEIQPSSNLPALHSDTAMWPDINSISLPASQLSNLTQ